MTSTKPAELPVRLFKDDAAWEAAFTSWEAQIAGYDDFRGQLDKSAESLAACLQFDNEFERAGERLGTYAFLKTAEDTANSSYQRMIGRYRNVGSRAAQAASYIRPEIMAIPAKTMESFLAAKPLAEFRLTTPVTNIPEEAPLLEFTPAGIIQSKTT